MRSKQRLLLLLMALLFLCIHQPSATSIGRVEKMNGNDEKRGRTVAHAGSVGGGGGGNGGSPGGDGSSHVPSGGGVTPVYAAAGAGNNHHPHHGGGNCDRGRAAPAALAVITFACFLLCIN